MQQIPMTSPPAVGYPTPDPQWLHRQQQISRMAQVHHAHQERAATPWAMNPYALNQSKLLRVVQTQGILFLKSMSDPPLSDIDFKNKMAWVWFIPYELPLNTRISPCNLILVVHYASSPEKIRQLIQRQEYNAIVEQKAFGQSNSYR